MNRQQIVTICKKHISPITLSILLISLALLPKELEQSLIFQRQSLLDGELWRLFSAHLLHLGWNHLALNLAGLWLLYWLAKDVVGTLEWFLTLLTSSLLISLALLFFSDVSWYVGLSGTLHSLLILAGFRLSQQQHREGLLLILLVVVKVAWEQWGGAAPGMEAAIGGNVVYDAHLFGMLAGVASIPILALIKRVFHSQ